MTLPNNFPLTEQQISGIKTRLETVNGYSGMSVAGPIRDLSKVFKALNWCLDKWGTWQSQKSLASQQNTVLKTYMASAEAVLAGYASGNWDGGAAANQLIQNMPQIP